jgi:ABC-type bacteriocin/lantibiotic exporter with double-glycine peptidase domain
VIELLKDFSLTLKGWLGLDDSDRVVGHPEFARVVQPDWFTCGARSTFMVMKHFGSRRGYERVERDLQTTTDGTYETHVIRVLRESGLRAGRRRGMKMADLERLLARGGVLIADVDDGGHYMVVHGLDRQSVRVADPSFLSLRRVSRARFRKRWDGSGVAVTPPV